MPTPWDTNADFKVPELPIPDTFPTARSTDPVPLPPREPSPTPSFTPKAATPKGSPGLWVRESDYPSRMVRMGIEGKTGFRLSIDGTGRVTGCEVTSSSGAEELDRAACAALRKRAIFKGATGADGQPVDSTAQARSSGACPNDRPLGDGAVGQSAPAALLRLQELDQRAHFLLPPLGARRDEPIAETAVLDLAQRDERAVRQRILDQLQR